MEELINLGLVHLSVNYEACFNCINTPNPERIHHAAFTWIMDNPDMKLRCDEFINTNTSYLETYLAFPQVKSLSTELQYSKFGKFMPAYSLFVFPPQLKFKYIVRHCKLFGIKITEKNLSCLADELPNLFNSVKNENNIKLVKSHISNWLQPLFDNINRVDIDHSVLEKITRYIDPLNIHNDVKTMGSVWRLKNKDTMYLCYMLGYPIHSMEKGPEDSVSILLKQLESAQNNRSPILKRVKGITIKDTLECASININLSMSSISDSRIQGLQEDYNNVSLNSCDSITRDDICTYSPFDIVRYVTVSGKIAQITRKEYPYVSLTGINPWIMEKVPDDILEEILNRNKLASEHSIPACETINTILDYVFPRGSFDNL